MAPFLVLAVGFSFLFSGLALPIDDDAVEILPDDNDIDNTIGGVETIDFSHLGSNVYGVPNNETGEAVAGWSEESLVNPEELGEYAEGDILIPVSPVAATRNGEAVAGWSEESLVNPEELGEYAEGDILIPVSPVAATRNGMKEESLRWPNGIVPYVIEGNYNQEQRDTIKKAIADYHRLTCLRFVPRSSQHDYVVIQSRNTGCWSSVGRIGGRQEVNLQAPGCVSKKGTVLHELLHAVGFLHEQSRPERDDYVKIRYDNVKYGSENNFKKADASRTGDFGVSYDYNSVMHYSEYAFSKNGQRTIEPKVSNVKVGQREGLSRGDVKKVNNMYHCNKSEPQQGWLGAVWSGFFGN